MITLPIASMTSAQGLLADTAAIAAVALIGYLFGRRTRHVNRTGDAKLLTELSRAQQIAGQLDQVAARIRSEVAIHHGSLALFQSQVARMKTGDVQAEWRRFSDQADALVAPTLKLATNLAQAYDELRHNQALLLTFSGSRIDAATGLQNRKAMDEQLDAQLALHADGVRRFSLAVFCVRAAQSEGDDAAIGAGRLRAVARLVEETVRGSDFVARYSEDELAVLMPNTALPGALIFAQRLLKRAQGDLDCPLWGGVVEAKPGESSDKLLSRADSALYSARTQAGPSLFQHNGAVPRRRTLAPRGEESACATESEPRDATAEGDAGDNQPAVCGRVG